MRILDMSDKILIKDIVIPAGTVFSQAPSKTTRDDTHYDCVIGLSDNTHGIFTYCIDEPDELAGYFATISDAQGERKKGKGGGVN
jgi:hypothetical protein